jgi:hypothetical protein
MKKLIFFVVAMLCWRILALPALDIRGGLLFTAQTDAAKPTTASRSLWGGFVGGVYQKLGDFEFLWSARVDNEGKYPQEALARLSGPLSYYAEDSGLRYSHDGIGITLGKFANYDMIDSPYSLFVSSAGNQAMMGEISLERGNFFYTDRWIGLNHNLQSGLYYTASDKDPWSCSTKTQENLYRDRGLVLKSFGLRFGRLRIGYQDALLYTGQYFNIDAFAIPAPGWLVQYAASAAGRPWTSTSDMNSLMGFFVDYTETRWYVYGQILVDDLNLDPILDPSAQNYAPNKLAASLGGRVDTKAGTFGLYLAGATRYTFESVRNEFYSYTYYPGSAVLSDDALVGIPTEDMMIGYINGENNFAAMLSWKKAFPIAVLTSSLEFKLTGAQSPANPWHDQVGFTSSDWFRWLDDPVLEKKLTLKLGASRSFGRMTVWAKATVGYVWNRLELTRVTAADLDKDSSDNYLTEADGSEPYWRPSNQSTWFGAISVGVQYSVTP